MSSKRGQIALYIILGLIIVVGIASFFAIQQDSQDYIPPAIESVDTDPIKTFVESCMSELGHDALHWIATRGGYFTLPELSSHESAIKAPYYFHLNENIMPTTRRVEVELARYVRTEMPFCLKNFVDFEEQGYEILRGNPIVEAQINDKSVEFMLDMKLAITQGDSQGSLQMFRTITHAPLSKYYFAAKAFVEMQMEDYSSVCISCIADLAHEHEVTFDLSRIEEDTVLIAIKDAPYTWQFTNKYSDVSCSNIPEDWPEERIQRIKIDCLRDGLRLLGG